MTAGASPAVPPLRKAKPVKRRIVSSAVPGPGPSKPLANYNTEDGDILRRMGLDAMRWAETFCEIYRERCIEQGRHPDITIDEGWLVGWFANAIEAGGGEGYNRGRADKLEYGDKKYKQGWESGRQELWVGLNAAIEEDRLEAMEDEV